MKTKYWIIALALVLILTLVPFSCLGEAAPAPEATPEQTYAEDFWSYGFDEDYWFNGLGEDVEYKEEEKPIMRLVDLLVYNFQIADWCKEEAAKLPEDSKIRRQYEEFEKLLREMQPGRPTEEESKAASEKALSNISTQLKEEAVEYYRRCVEVEPKITADLCDITDELGTELFGIKFRLKSAGDNANGVCRFADKIDANMKEAEKAGHPISYREAAEGVHDLVRYTMASTPKTLVPNYLETKEKLEAKGYRFVRVKNTWESYSITFRTAVSILRLNRPTASSSSCSSTRLKALLSKRLLTKCMKPPGIRGFRRKKGPVSRNRPLSCLTA